MQTAPSLRVPWVGKGRRPFYGWVVVSASFVTQFMVGVAFQGFATYVLPLQAEFGWSKANLAGPRSLTQAEGAILGPINGYLVDRLGPRVMVALGTLVVGGGLILFGFTQALWQYYLVNVLIAVGTSFSGLLVAAVAINNWFRRKRTLALAVATMGFSMFGIIGVPLLLFGQNHFGWRETAIASGILVFIIGFPSAYFMRGAPERYGLLPDGAQAHGQHKEGGDDAHASAGYTLKQAMRTPAFWFLGVGNGLTFMAMSAITVHQIAHMEEGVGLTAAAAGLAFTIMSVLNLGGRFAGGFLGDRFSKQWVLLGSMTLTAGSLVLFALARSFAQVVVFAVLYGFAWGLRAPVTNSLQGDIFGRAAFGRISGMLQVVSSPLSLIGPVLAGYLADVMGSYDLAFILLACSSGVGGGLFFLVRPPRKRRQNVGVV